MEVWEKMQQEGDVALEAISNGACGCHRCIQERGHSSWHMVVCPTCGNKRCPKASDHNYACTNSNEPGQTGSVYSPVPSDHRGAE